MPRKREKKSGAQSFDLGAFGVRMSRIVGLKSSKAAGLKLTESGRLVHSQNPSILR